MSKPPDIRFVDLNAHHARMRDEIDAAIAGVIERSTFILGDEVDAFEREFAAFTGTAHGIGASNGYDALILALRALDIGPGDEVIVPANTYVATAFAASVHGARPVLVDCDPATMAMDCSHAAAAVTANTRVIMPVHLAGHPVDMDAVAAIADAHGLAVVEDAAQAHGARFHGKRCGSFGHMGCFSLYPSKNLGALGDGGIITTDDDHLADSLRRLRNYGQRHKYEHLEIGYNHRLDTLQAAILRVKLRRLDRANAARRRHAAAYRERLGGVGDIGFFEEADGCESVFHLFVVQTERRDELQRHLANDGIETVIHYPVPVHLQPACAGLAYVAGDFPVAERLARTSLSLPMYPELTEDQIDRVCDSVRAFFGG